MRTANRRQAPATVGYLWVVDAGRQCLHCVREKAPDCLTRGLEIEWQLLSRDNLDHHVTVGLEMHTGITEWRLHVFQPCGLHDCVHMASARSAPSIRSWNLAALPARVALVSVNL